MHAKKNVPVSPKATVALQSKSNNSFLIVAALILVIITSAIYYSSLNNQLTTWDDDYYITNNPDIKTLHGDSVGVTIKKTFTSYVSGNYHPLTMLSLCLDYNKHQLEPRSYHLTNLILHIFNTLLVFCFIWLLTKQLWVAFITALLFAIHPMHVESVAWASERKDVLYSFFYLSALCCYVLYLKKEKWNVVFYALSFLLFGMAVLSKAMAVSLPIVLVAIDYLLNRKITSKTILEKAPFLILSLIFGYIAIQAQKSSNAVHIDYYNFADRFLFTCYGIMMYVWKLIAPFNLSCYYNYPTKLNGVFPAIVYISPIVIAAILFLIYRSLRFGKDVAFGFSFFIVSIALVLQILPVGGAIISDRYSYVPYIGLFFIIARGINYLLENSSENFSSLKIPSITALIVFAVMCCYLSFQRTKVWHDSVTLWDNAIKNEKFDVAPLAYKGRATAYYMAGQYEKAVLDYGEYLKILNNNPDVYCDKGIALYNLNKYNEAIIDLNKAIEINPKHLRALHFRGLSYFNLKNYTGAINDFSNALQIKANYPFAYYTRGLSFYYLGKYNESINDYTTAIKYDSKYVEAYSNRGLAYFQTRQFDEAINNYSTAVQLNPAYSNAYYNRALVYDQLKKYDAAIADYTKTIELMPNFAGAYNSRANNYFAIQKYELALNDLIKAQQIGFAVDVNFIKLLQSKTGK